MYYTIHDQICVFPHIPWFLISFQKTKWVELIFDIVMGLLIGLGNFYTVLVWVCCVMYFLLVSANRCGMLVFRCFYVDVSLQGRFLCTK